METKHTVKILKSAQMRGIGKSLPLKHDSTYQYSISLRLWVAFIAQPNKLGKLKYFHSIFELEIRENWLPETTQEQ